LDAGDDFHLFQAIHEGERVDDGREHAHVVACGAFDAAFFPGESAKDVAAADDDADLDAEGVDFLNLGANAFEGEAVYGVAGGFAAQDFAAEFEDDAFVFDRRGAGGVEWWQSGAR
jgi:hypothetical protein